MTYCFRCTECGESVESSNRNPYPTHDCGGQLRRDYQAEGAAPHVVALKREREAGGRSAVRDMFLPKAKDFESPSDPDGTKGISKWNEEHGPRAGNKNPLRPEQPKKSFAIGGK